MKLAAPSTAAPAMTEDGALLNYTNVPLIVLVMRAYRVKYRQVVGPEWQGSERYDVAARLPEDAGKDHIRRMLQALLTDRFRMAVHTETKMVPGFALAMGKGALRMKTAEGGDGARRMKGPKGLEIKGNTTMAKLADVLSDALDCPVVDSTGLSGFSAVDLNWTPDENPAMRGPSIMSAAQEELGLKLEARKYPYDFLVIDRAEKLPTKN